MFTLGAPVQPTPPHLQAILGLFADYPHLWAVCGGWAIDLYLNRQTRPHADIDIALERRRQLDAQTYVLARGWTLAVASQGQLIPWQVGEWLDLPIHSIWCRHPSHQPDFVELLLNEIDDEAFSFRRDPTLTRPRHQAILTSAAGIPILAPEIALLYKSTRPTEGHNTDDFRACLPTLSPDARAWLHNGLTRQDTHHLWLAAF